MRSNPNLLPCRLYSSKCRDYSGEYRLEQNISREKGCGDDIAAKCLQFIKILYGWDDRRSRYRNFWYKTNSSGSIINSYKKHTNHSLTTARILT